VPSSPRDPAPRVSLTDDDAVAPSFLDRRRFDEGPGEGVGRRPVLVHAGARRFPGAVGKAPGPSAPSKAAVPPGRRRRRSGPGASSYPPTLRFPVDPRLGVPSGPGA